MNVFVKRQRRSEEASSQQATDKLLSIVDETSLQNRSQLQNLIDELQQLQRRLDDNGKRVQQQIAEFAYFSQTTLEFAEQVRDGASDVKRLPNTEHREDGD